MIHQLDIYGKDKVENAIEMLRFFEPKDGTGYFLAFSGGKDSCCIKKLADLAGVKYDAHYHVTTVDPPELVRFIKANYPDVAFDHSRDKEGKPITMWSLIEEKSVPPTRHARYCCQHLKEGGGMGRMVITGVRWAESARRKALHGAVTIPEKRTVDNDSFMMTNRGGAVLGLDSVKIFLNNDNDEGREAVDFCIKQRKTVVNPIIDWEDDDVWEFIREYNIPYCELYDEGFERLGCIGCPLAGTERQQRDFNKWPQYKKIYIHAFERMLKRKARHANTEAWDWKTGEDVFNWWTNPRPGQR